jgi:hypothetical protein
MSKMKPYALVKFGKILLGDTEVPCTIGKLSKVGACLIVQTTHGIPASFEFMMPNRAPKICKVIWRDDKRLGVHFRQGTLPGRTDEVIE